MFTRLIELGPAAFPDSSAEMPKALQTDYFDPIAERLIRGIIGTNAVSDPRNGWRRLTTKRTPNHSKLFNPASDILVFSTMHKNTNTTVVTGGVTQYGGNKPPQIIRKNGEQQLRHAGPSITFYLRAEDYNTPYGKQLDVEARQPELLNLELRYDPGTGDDRDLQELDYVLEGKPPLGDTRLINLSYQVTQLLESISG